MGRAWRRLPDYKEANGDTYRKAVSWKSARQSSGLSPLREVPACLEWCCHSAAPPASSSLWGMLASRLPVLPAVP